MQPKISIITPWLDHPEFIPDFERAVRSEGVEVIVVDNGSAPPTAETLREMTARLNGKYLRNESNRWFSAANNQGLAVATGKTIVFLNNDIAGDPAWLPRAAAEVSPGALYGPELLHIEIDGQRIDYLMGWCVAGIRQDWETLGGWDEKAHSMPYWEDKDLGYRATRAGLRLVATDWTLRHKGQGTSTDVPGVRHGFMRVRQSFIDRVRGIESPAPGGGPVSPSGFDKAMALYRAARLPEAELAFQFALEQEAGQPQMWQEYSAVLHLSGRHEASVEALRRAIALEPGRAEYYINLGAILGRLKRHEEAADALRAALARDPKSPHAHNNLARVLFNQEKYQEAEQSARQALRLRPSLTAAHVNLSRALVALGRIEEGLAVASAAVVGAPREVIGYIALAEAFRAAGRLHEALARYDQALQLVPNDLTAVQGRQATLAALEASSPKGI